MKILIIGGGGREHAIALSLTRSKHHPSIYCAPGNAGISTIATCVPIKPMDFLAIRDYAVQEAMDLVIVGMDDPLVGGLVDVLQEANIPTFGPNKAAAIIEGSKTFAKELMRKYKIPTATYESFGDMEEAKAYLTHTSYPIVIKADGLALGKGVYICLNQEEAYEAVSDIMLNRKFGSAGERIVIEEYMTGREVSVLTFVDGKTIQTMSSAQDHKRIGDGDTGPNTGGMGVFSPSPYYTEEIDVYCMEHIYQPTVDAMRQEGREFKGVLYFGLMLTKQGPKVVEYNARFGDPEAQVILPRLNTDLIDVMYACINGSLDQIPLQFEDKAAVGVVLASGGYPGSYELGFPISGLQEIETMEDAYCFHAGTALDGSNNVVTSGGRVLCVTGFGKDLSEARMKAYEATELVDFTGKYKRSDIGKAFRSRED